MNDLLLWRLLRAGSFEPAEIAPLLRDLAGLSLAERTPFFGLLPVALEHADPTVREAAVTALGGAHGRLALQRLVAALGDAAAPVRAAAVEALRASLHNHDGARWAHVLFHPQADVRLAGIASGKD